MHFNMLAMTWVKAFNKLKVSRYYKDYKRSLSTEKDLSGIMLSVLPTLLTHNVCL